MRLIRTARKLFKSFAAVLTRLPRRTLLRFSYRSDDRGKPNTPQGNFKNPQGKLKKMKAFSYRGHPVAITVKIHDQDVTDDLASVDDIIKSVDYPNLTEFRVGECQFTLRDVHGYFSPNKTVNFWTQNGGRRTGYQSPVNIEAGFIVNGTRHTETVFQGNIIRLVQNAKAATLKVVCVDNFGDVRTKGITDFGIDRHFMVDRRFRSGG